MHPDCESISLDYLIKKKEKEFTYENLSQRSKSLRSQLEQFEATEKKLMARLELAQNGSNKCMIKECEDNLNDLTRNKKRLENQLMKVCCFF
jgi:hypothetical protein